MRPTAKYRPLQTKAAHCGLLVDVGTRKRWQPSEARGQGVTNPTAFLAIALWTGVISAGRSAVGACETPQEAGRVVCARRDEVRLRSMRKAIPRVVIVGGGFGGLSAAKALKDALVKVILIDRTNHHLFQPLLYQV